MTTSVATADVPVLTMCADPACGGMLPCPAWKRDQERMTGRTMGISELVRADAPAVTGEQVIHMLATELAIGFVSDGQGRRRVIPAGCEFTVHKIAEGDHVRYYAGYSGPETHIDAILGDAPEWDAADATARLEAVKAAYPVGV